MGDRPDRGEAVGQAGAVGHQIVDGDVAIRGDGVVQRTLGRPEHARVRELRRPFRDRVAELQLAFLHQHQGGDRGDRLGHRGDAEKGVALHRQALREIALAAQGELDDLALAPDQGNPAGKVARVDRSLNRVRGAFEAFHVEAAHRNRAVIHPVSPYKAASTSRAKAARSNCFPVIKSNPRRTMTIWRAGMMNTNYPRLPSMA